MSARRLLSICLVALAVVRGSARIESLEIDHDDRTVFHIQSFGYEPGGVLNVTLRSFTVILCALLLLLLHFNSSNALSPLCRSRITGWAKM